MSLSAGLPMMLQVDLLLFHEVWKHVRHFPPGAVFLTRTFSPGSGMLWRNEQ